jgi:type I restriction enzyme S subunit
VQVRNWKEYLLGDCIELLSGGTPSKQKRDYWGGDIPWVSPKDMKVDRIYDTEDHLTVEGTVNGTRVIPANTILIVVRGMILAKEFPVALTKCQVAFNQDLKAVLPSCDELDNQYLYHWFRANRRQVLGIVDEAAHGTTRIQTDRLLNLFLQVPPLPIQHRIAAVLSAYDDLIENNTQRIAALEATAQTLYREWFVEFRFPGHESVAWVESELGPIPVGWEVVTAADLYETSSGGTPSRKTPEYFGGNFLWAKTRELSDCFIFDTEERITALGPQKSSAKLFPPQTVLIAMYGATIGQLGILAEEAATNQACCAFLQTQDEFGYAYIYLYLHTNRQKIIGLGMGAAQQNISQQVIKRFEILKPDSFTMHRFNDMVEPMFKQIEVLQRKNASLREARDQLLSRLISGELSVESVNTVVFEDG